MRPPLSTWLCTTGNARPTNNASVLGGRGISEQPAITAPPSIVSSPPLVKRSRRRHGRQGLWYERELAFDAALLKPGANVLKIIVPAGPINNGILYDYVRLELNESL